MNNEELVTLDEAKSICSQYHSQLKGKTKNNNGISETIEGVSYAPAIKSGKYLIQVIVSKYIRDVDNKPIRTVYPISLKEGILF